MTTYWTRYDARPPKLDKGVLVYRDDTKLVGIFSLSFHSWCNKYYWEDEDGFGIEVESKDMWCEIPYPESTEICVYDNREVYDNCTVEIWSNENNMSIGWWKNERNTFQSKDCIDR